MQAQRTILFPTESPGKCKYASSFIIEFTFFFFFLVLVIVFVINCWSVKWGERMKNIFIYAKLPCIVTIIVIGFVELGKGLFEAYEIRLRS